VETEFISYLDRKFQVEKWNTWIEILKESVFALPWIENGFLLEIGRHPFYYYLKLD